ncbi:DUF3443 family protein [Kitasatospora sp. LaBMicrA B282]|uniref:DUF3443 family protein n=1 Tax=Kitasatospora sp. LaBMicrA B282 TaxID=3420949 RepID=UPI003D0C2BC2
MDIRAVHMKRSLLTLLLCAGAAAVGAAPAQAMASTSSTGSFPFQVWDAANYPRAIVPITIGGSTLNVLLDTGSTGLRVVADKVPAGAASSPGITAPPYGFGSGVQLTGTINTATVQIGDYSTGAIPVELVTGTSCSAAKPNCEAANGAKPQEFGGQFDGIMGVAMSGATDMVNPLWNLQDAGSNLVGRQFAVHYDPTQPTGSVLLNVPADGYTTVQLPSQNSTATPPTWNPRAIQACIATQGVPAGGSCGDTLFDTGTPTFDFQVPGATQTTVPAGQPLTLSVPAAGWSRTYTVTSGGRAELANAAPSTGNPSLAGLPAFAGTDIRFDLANGTIGFPNADVTAAPVANAPFAAATTATLLAGRFALRRRSRRAPAR